MIKYLLASDHEFLVKTPNDEFFLNKLNSYQIEVESNEKPVLQFFPMFSDPKSVPFVVVLNGLKLGDNISQIKIEDTYYLKINPYEIISAENIMAIKTFEINKKNIEVIQTNKKIIIFNGAKKLMQNIQSDKFNFFIQENFLVGIGQKNLIYYGLENNKINYFAFDKINYEKSTCQTLLDTNNPYGHVVVNNISINNNELTIKQELYYKNGQPTKITNPKLFAHAILDCVKIEDYNLAKSYFNNSLMLSANNLKDYFGDFDEYLYFNNHYYLIKNDKAYKKLDFAISNGKVVDIIDKEL